MARNCFVLLGMVFLILLAILGIFLVIGFFDASGQPVKLNGTPVTVPSIIEKTNPLETLAVPLLVPTSTPIPPPTATPDPVKYRTTVLLRAKQFSNALEAFMQTNTRLRDDPGLVNDPEWKSEIAADLEVFVSSARELGGIQPAPDEYQSINTLLAQVVPEAEELQLNYMRGVDTGDQQAFNNAGENLNRIAEIMKQAQATMVAAGWNP